MSVHRTEAIISAEWDARVNSMTFARIVGGGICIMSPAAARQTRTAQSAADGSKKAPAKAGALPKAEKLEVKRAGRRREAQQRKPTISCRRIRATDHPNRRQQRNHNPPFGGYG